MRSVRLALALALGVWLAGCASLLHAPGGANGPEPAAEAAASAGKSGHARDMPPLPVEEVHSGQVASLDAPVDLWSRIRVGFAMPDLDNDLVRKQESWYVAQPQYLERMTERSRMYLFHIVEELELRGMPTELALLPFVESAYNPQAVSGAKAAGIWQFMPATGRHFDLTQTAFRDDRRDVLGSTRAALDYLDKLHAAFGNWQLALAAYNAGSATVSRAIRQNQDAGLSTDYADLPLPAETRLYVPRLQAIKNIVARPDAFHVRLPDIGNHPFFDTVTISHDIDVAVAAQLAHMQIEDFKALNPSHSKPVIFATGTPQVLLPWDNVALFEKNLKAYDPAKLASWTAWVAPATMSTREAAKREGMDLREFREVNGIPANAMVKAGSTLLVPRRRNEPGAVSSQVVNNASLSFTSLRRMWVHAHKNDTIATLAARFDLPAATVAGWNKTSPNAKLVYGETVTLYLPASPREKSRAPGHAKAQTRNGRSHYTTARNSGKNKTGKSGAKDSVTARNNHPHK